MLLHENTHPQIVEKCIGGPYMATHWLLQWVLPDGSIRENREEKKEFAYPGAFTAAEKTYTSWRELCISDPENGCYRDIYGRKVLSVQELFPCFDTYDYLYEDRYYRWFFLCENGRLTMVMYADEENTITVTEDVSVMKPQFRVQVANWLEL